jgi:hypothetical protein
VKPRPWVINGPVVGQGEYGARAPADKGHTPGSILHSIVNVIRLPNVTPKNAAQAQWSHTLPQDFAETIPTATCLTEDESPDIDEPPIKT